MAKSFDSNENKFSPLAGDLPARHRVCFSKREVLSVCELFWQLVSRRFLGISLTPEEDGDFLCDVLGFFEIADYDGLIVGTPLHFEFHE